jgi:hypothetical protein
MDSIDKVCKTRGRPAAAKHKLREVPAEATDIIPPSTQQQTPVIAGWKYLTRRAHMLTPKKNAPEPIVKRAIV